MWTKRQGIIVWLKNIKFVQKLKRQGHIIYVSKKQKYMVMYVNQDEVDDVMKSINNLPFVIKVEPSYKPFIKTEYEKVTFEKSKEYDYKYDI